MLRSTRLAHPRLRHAFSLALAAEGAAAAFRGQAGLAGLLVSARQVHGCHVLTVSGAGDGGAEADALVTDRPGLAVAVRTADCVPLLMADPEAGVVAAVHAGWRGTRLGIVRRALEAMRALGAREGRILAALGPAIEASCYEVGEDVAAAFRLSLPSGLRHFGADGRHLDVRAVNHELLLEAGLDAENVEVLAECTRCDARFASYRRERAYRSTNVSAIALAPR